ncbi:MAG TPA: hypothetical protein VM425_13830 [Myxococcota bacterium]|nr:hypothetical protein [Myxococcota bacterium]
MADGLAFNFNLRLSNRFFFKRNQLDLESGNPLDLRFDKDELGYSAFAAAGMDVDFWRAVALHLSVDSGELKFRPLGSYNPDLAAGVTANSRPIADEAERTGFLREAYLSSSVGRDGWFTVKAGKMLVSTGNGFIMDNYALGAAVGADLDLGFEVPFKLSVDALLPNGDFTSDGKKSPFVFFEAAYLMSFFEEIGVFFAWYEDNDDSIGDIMRSVIGEAILNGQLSGGLDQALADAVMGADIQTHGDLFWIGLRANKIFSRASLSLTAIIEFGKFDYTIDLPPFAQLPDKITGRPSCLGGMADLSFYYDLTDGLTLGGFFLFLSGETFTKNEIRRGALNKYNSFISVYPYITRTNLFFSGGMNQNFSARGFSASGINGRGVLAPGLTLGWDIIEDLNVRLVGAALFSHGAHLTSESHFYGIEADLNAEWRVTSFLSVLLEADYLHTGPFFDFDKPLGNPQGFVTEPEAFKIMLGLDLFY